MPRSAKSYRRDSWDFSVLRALLKLLQDAALGLLFLAREVISLNSQFLWNRISCLLCKSFHGLWCIREAPPNLTFVFRRSPNPAGCVLSSGANKPKSSSGCAATRTLFVSRHRFLEPASPAGLCPFPSSPPRSQRRVRNFIYYK